MTPAIQDNPPQASARRIEELGRIIMAYSEVTERLQESHRKLQEQVQALSGELGEKNRLLERRNRLAALGEMAAGMAHEIRNPLGGIRLYASMLAKDLTGMAGPSELVARIAGGVGRLESIVSQVLAFSREMRPSAASVNVGELARRAVELSGGRLEQSGVDCQILGPQNLSASVDPLMMEQAILNLVLNAADAMDAGGRLRIEFDRGEAVDARQFRLLVRDSGPGIAPEALERVFNPFFTTKHTGTGLGLAIVHRIVESHEGTIIASNPPGGGAQFEIRI